MTQDTSFSGQPLELMARKLVQDGLIQCGVLELQAKNRSKGAATPKHPCG